MGFYYGSNKPPEEEPGGLKETIAIIAVVFRTLALPLGLLFGGMAALLFEFWLFTLSPFAGLAGLACVVGALVARGVWEAKHPPDIG